jgi:hypothetical protein
MVVQQMTRSGVAWQKTNNAYYHQSATAEDNAVYPHGSEAKEDDTTYGHRGMAKDKATYPRGSVANNNAP